MNPAYRHLEEPIKIGDFTLVQLAGFLLCFGLAMLWGFLISPFGPMVTLFTAIYIGGLPAMAVLMASTSDFDVLRMIRAYVRFQRRPGHFLPGPGSVERGYVINRPQEPEGAKARRNAQNEPLIGEALWGE